MKNKSIEFFIFDYEFCAIKCFSGLVSGRGLFGVVIWVRFVDFMFVIIW